MHQFESGLPSTPTHPTLASMPHIRAELNADLAKRYPTVGVDILDRGAPGGVLHYAIAPVRETDGVTYGLYYDGHRVPSPMPLLSRYQLAFDRQLAQVDPRLAARMYRDLGAQGPDVSFVYARALPDSRPTPVPQRHSYSRPSIAVVGRDDTRERKTPRLLSSSLPDRMESALSQMRMLIAKGTIHVRLLENKGGYYANIVDLENRQLHQIGYSFSRDLPWHVVFQLKDGVDIVHGPYKTPKPTIARQKVRYDRNHRKYMQQVDQKKFDPKDTDAKDAVRQTLGITTRRRGHLYEVPRQPVGAMSQPSNPRLQRSATPEWMHSIMGTYFGSIPPISQPRSAVRPTPLPQHREVTPPPAFIAPAVPLRRASAPPQRLNASNLINPNSFPDWLREVGEGDDHEPRGSQANELERRRTPASPPTRQIPDVEEVRQQIHNLRPSIVAPAPIIAGQYPYELVQFGGYAGIHTSYAFV